MSSILTTPIFRARISQQIETLTLPGLIAALLRDDVRDLPALRPHQRQPLHCFLAQLCALALLQAERSEIPTTEDEWRMLLEALTPGQIQDAWSLIVADVTKPAFLQAPIPEGKIDALKQSTDTPDGLDMLVTSKNHDLKIATMTDVRYEHWFYAILTLQTLEGFLGKGNYGISRMNGGFASRPMIGLAPSGGAGAHLLRDLRRLLDLRAEQIDKGNSPYQLKAGLALLWLEPWDGRSPINPAKLDPYYIEICRRIRLVEDKGRIIARRGSSDAGRIAFPKTANGVTGDPWTPIDIRKEPKALTVDASGFNYRRVTEIMIARAAKPSYDPAPLQEWRQDDGDAGLEFTLTAIARGQGKTEGFHERRIPYPAGMNQLLSAQPDAFALLARKFVQLAGEMRGSVLRTALFVLFQNAPEKINTKHKPSEEKAAPLLAAFDRAVDSIFFDTLFTAFQKIEEAGEDVEMQWLEQLKRIAIDQLEAAAKATPRSGLRRFTSHAAARNALEAIFRKKFGVEQ